MITEVKMKNGVDLEALANTIEAIKETPSLAQFQFRAKNKWIEAGENKTAIKGFHGAGEEDSTRTKPFVLKADEPLVLLGKDKAANPAEYVLHSLAACLTTSMVYHAAAQGIEIEEIESRLEGEIDLHGFLGLSDFIRKGYEGVKVTFKVKSDASEEQLRELTKFSPVYDIVSNPVPVSIEFEK